jgi:hypothetical protein
MIVSFLVRNRPNAFGGEDDDFAKRLGLLVFKENAKFLI